METKSNRNSQVFITTVVIINYLLMASLIWFARTCENRVVYNQVSHDTIEYVKKDTFVVNKPVPIEHKVVRYERVEVHDTIMIHDTVFFVDLPIYQLEYNDSLYTAWVSGYNPSLDSLHIYSNDRIIEITKTETTYKPYNWSFGVHAGYGVYKDGFSPYIGIGISYNIFNW